VREEAGLLRARLLLFLGNEARPGRLVGLVGAFGLPLLARDEHGAEGGGAVGPLQDGVLVLLTEEPAGAAFVILIELGLDRGGDVLDDVVAEEEGDEQRDGEALDRTPEVGAEALDVVAEAHAGFGKEIVGVGGLAVGGCHGWSRGGSVGRAQRRRRRAMRRQFMVATAGGPLKRRRRTAAQPGQTPRTAPL